ncbi:MAG: asparaginase [Rhodoferax sp.]|nr:asparaginase [Rhodoferax sp.]
MGTGGTIAGAANSASDNVGYLAAQVGVESLIASLPGLSERLGGTGVCTEQVRQLDSKDMDWADLAAIAVRAHDCLARPDVMGLVITHGTDTLEETAFFLSQVLPADLLAIKPVILTCAMRPVTSMTPDGPQNLLDAVTLTVSGAGSGVLVVCAGNIHAARDVQKVHPYRLNAFDSGDAGPLGCIEEGEVRWQHDCAFVNRRSADWDMDLLRETAWPRVEVVMNHVGASGAIVRSLCARSTVGDSEVSGLVVAGTGNGTLHHALELALLEVQKQGVRVVLSTRCAYGQVIPSGLSALPHANGLSPVKARIALTLDILASRAKHG